MTDSPDLEVQFNPAVRDDGRQESDFHFDTHLGHGDVDEDGTYTICDPAEQGFCSGFTTGCMLWGSSPWGSSSNQ